MAFGILLFEIDGEQNISVLSKYFIDGENKEIADNLDLLKYIAKKHGMLSGETDLKSVHSHRTDGLKLFSIYISEPNSDKKGFIVFVLDKSEQNEPYSVMIAQLKDIISIAKTKGKSLLDSTLKQVLENRIELSALPYQKEQIQKKLSNVANKLLDEGNFEKAQEYIKLAQEVPTKLTDLVIKGDNLLKNKNYRGAAKAYSDASSLANKINQSGLAELMRKKAAKASEIPKYNKSKLLYLNQIEKGLSRLNKRISSNVYRDPINSIDGLLNIADVLENDEEIAVLQELIDILEDSDLKYQEILDGDKKIKELFSKLK